MLGEGTSSYLRKPPRFLGGSDDFFFGWKRPEEDDAGERCDVERGDEWGRPLDEEDKENCRLCVEPDDVKGRDWAPLYKETSLAASRAASIEAGAKRSFWSKIGSDRSLRFWVSGSLSSHKSSGWRQSRRDILRPPWEGSLELIQQGVIHGATARIAKEAKKGSNSPQLEIVRLHNAS